jgi:tetratricopeptide (TPR) repeat protein
LKPDYAEAYNNREYSNYYGSKANLDQAIADYSKAIELRPEYAYAYNNRGAAFLASGFPHKAISDLDHALQLKPGFPQAYSNHGNTYLRKPNHPGLLGFFARK